MMDLLERIYGADVARGLAARVEAVLRKYRGVLGVGDEKVVDGRRRAPIDERTAVLITYGDQVRDSGEAPLATLAEFLERHARGIVTGVHLLPFYPYSSDDGFAVMDYRAVDPALGTWDDVARVGEHFDLMLDAVINHASTQGEWFKKFLRNASPERDYFFVVTDDFVTAKVIRPRTLPLLTEFETAGGVKRVWTTFSADQADLDYRNPELLLEILDVLLFYVAQGARMVRLDAIGFLWKESGTTCLHLPQTHAVIQFFRAALNEVAPDVILVTETNVPHADNISYFGDGTNEAQWVYNFALPPLVLHTLQTGDATKLARWAQNLKTPGDGTAFFNFLASHDGVGLNPARGILTEAEIEGLVARTLERGGLISYKNNADGSKSPYEMNINYLDALTTPGEAEDVAAARFLCGQAMMLALKGVPGIYFHSMFGSRGDRAGAEASGMARRINREKFLRADLERELADPDSRRSRIFGRYAELLKVRGEHAAFDPKAGQMILEDDAQVLAVMRSTERERVLCLQNVTERDVIFGWKGAGRWRNLFTGAGAEGGVIPLAPYEVAWLAQED